jgi:hypothetical protein
MAEENNNWRTSERSSGTARSTTSKKNWNDDRRNRPSNPENNRYNENRYNNRNDSNRNNRNDSNRNTKQTPRDGLVPTHDINNFPKLSSVSSPNNVPSLSWKDAITKKETIPNVPTTQSIIKPKEKQKQVVNWNKPMNTDPLPTFIPISAHPKKIKPVDTLAELPIGLEPEIDPLILQDMIESAYWDQKYNEELYDHYNHGNDDVSTKDDIIIVDNIPITKNGTKIEV